MKKPDIKMLFDAVKRYAVTFGNVNKDAKLAEICDFDDSYGFLFEADDIFGNLYWCIDKKTLKTFAFRPNQDMKKFIDRKPMPIENVL